MNTLFIAGLVLVVVGLAGTVLPALPGTPLIFAGLFLAAWSEGFTKVGWFPLTLLAILTALSIAVDFAATALGAKRVGASKGALVGAAAGSVVGLFFGLPGLILGPFIGAVAGELVARRDLLQAGKAGLGTWLGLLLGTVAKLALAFTMLAVFVTAYFF